MKRYIYILFFLGVQVTFSQVTIMVDNLPKKTPKNASMFISGDFEGWTGGISKYQLQNNNGKYSITIPKHEISILYKFTLGSWDTAESTSKGAAIENRVYKFNKPNDTIKVSIAGWSHQFELKEKSTATKNVTILSEDFEIPQLNRKRRIWLYLPPNYKVSKKKFPVIYMHDGQNLFDKSTSNYGEWNVDETLNKIFKEKNFEAIVVGIDNGVKKRLDEYSPWKNEKYGGGEGATYVDFIVNTLKPYIDSNYKTLTDKQNTAIFGSSMGGLISQYAALQYPKIFGKIGVYSPAFWFAPEIKEFTKRHADITDTKMYFLAGGKEGLNAGYQEISETVAGMNSIISILKNNGFPPSNIQSKVVPEGKHNEKLWSDNFEEAIIWLFKDQIKPVRTFKEIKSFTNNQLEVKMSDGCYHIQFYNSKIVETTFLPNCKKNKIQSHAVVLAPNAQMQLTDTQNLIDVFVKDLHVKIQKKPFHISYWYKNKQVISEKNGYQKSDDFESIHLALTDEEVLYGGGARALGMNRRGNRLQLYNKAHYGYETRSELMNFTMPLVLSSKKYAVHFDNAPIGYLDLDSNNDNTLSYQTISGRKTYQVIVGDSWLDLIDNYTDLTGKQPMPARWVLGNFSSRFGYHSQNEVEKTIDKFNQDNIPVDAVILDLFWFGKNIKGTMGNLEVYKDSFPDMKGMVSSLKNKNVKTILITEPFVVNTSTKWDEAVKKDVLAKDSIGNPAQYEFYFGTTGIIDIYKKQGKQWFWNIYKDIINLGVKGLWGDLGEPEVHPSWVQHKTGSADEVHNIYGHDWARLIYEGYQKEFPNERPFILMRAGYSGSQRFGMIPWSGDVNRTWGGLQSQPEIALQMGMQGLGYMHSDLGGFAGANLDDNLYTRWLQYGVFQPIFRPHAQEEVPSEPVYRNAKTKQLAKESIELRYQLLPYNYNLVFENNQKGAPLMRPLFFEDTSDSLNTKASTYLWGKDFLITPIVKDSVKTKEIYFPKTSNWFNFYTDKKMLGGSKEIVEVQENSIPTYVRSGAFIPMTKSIQTTDDYNPNDLEIHYYFDNDIPKSNSKIFQDDGITAQAFEKGEFEILEFSSAIIKSNLEIDFEAIIGKNWKDSDKKIQFVIHNPPKNIKKIQVNKRKISFVKNNNTIQLPIKWDTANNIQIKISLK